MLRTVVGGRNITQEIHPLHQFHGKEPMFALGAEFVEGDEVGMVNIGQGAELVLEAVERARPLTAARFSTPRWRRARDRRPHKRPRSRPHPGSGVARISRFRESSPPGIVGATWTLDVVNPARRARMRDRGANHLIGRPCPTSRASPILRQGLGRYLQGRCLQETAALLPLCQERFHFRSQRVIAAAGLLQEAPRAG